MTARIAPGIGRLNTSSGFRRFLNGWLDAVRLTEGVARYGGAFNPPQGPYSAYKALGVARSDRRAVIGVPLPAVSWTLTARLPPSDAMLVHLSPYYT